MRRVAGGRRRHWICAAPIVGLSIFVFALSGCATKLLPFRLSAEPADFATLVGEWTGEYRGRESGRSGNIIFRLQEGSDRAYGDVLMIPIGSVSQSTESQSRRPQTTAEASCGTPPPEGQVLAISFVRAEQGAISGSLAPYRDPEHGCTVQTTFTGRLTSESTIEGTFSTSGVGLPSAQTGTWKVTRKTGS